MVKLTTQTKNTLDFGLFLCHKHVICDTCVTPLVHRHVCTHNRLQYRIYPYQMFCVKHAFSRLIITVAHVNCSSHKWTKILTWKENNVTCELDILQRWLAVADVHKNLYIIHNFAFSSMNYIQSIHMGYACFTDENKTLHTKSQEMCFFTWEFNNSTCCLLLNTWTKMQTCKTKTLSPMTWAFSQLSSSQVHRWWARCPLCVHVFESRHCVSD